jgi:asparagine synthetase A
MENEDRRASRSMSATHIDQIFVWRWRNLLNSIERHHIYLEQQVESVYMDVSEAGPFYHSKCDTGGSKIKQDIIIKVFSLNPLSERRLNYW